MNRSRLSSVVLAVALVGALVAVSCGGAGKLLKEAAPAATPGTEPVPAAETAPAPAVQAPPRPTATAVPATATPAPVVARTSAESGRKGDEKLAAELTGISSWINADPFTLESKRGSVVLVDFWTYTCINCIRTLRYLKQWQEKYADKGLVIVGVHTPEFEFEKNRDNVVKAVGEFGLEYAVAQDNDYGTWRAFENRFWPAKYLIDKDGYVRYTHFGEGQYQATEEWIRKLLVETETKVSDISLGEEEVRVYDPAARTRDPETRLTRELYAGFDRNFGAVRSGQTPPYIRHQEYYQRPDMELSFEDPGEHVNNFIYLQGLWKTGMESIDHARETRDYEDWIAIKFYATSVNVVMSPEGGEPYAVRITMDGGPLTAEQAGADIMFDDEGNSYVAVDEPDMYRLVSIESFEGHELRLSSNSDDFSVFAFTFGAFKPQAGL